MQILINEDKWISYIIDLKIKGKVKDCFKILKNEDKILKNNLIILAQLALCPAFHMVTLKYKNQSLTTPQNFDLFYQQ